MKQAIVLLLGLFVLSVPVNSYAVKRWWQVWKVDEPIVELEAIDTAAPDAEFEAFGAEITGLFDKIVAIETEVIKTGAKLAPKEALLIFEQKLKPQLKRPGHFILVGVQGGTKVGKSLVVRTLSKEAVSASSHIPGATKTSVVIVPRAIADDRLVADLFPHMRPTRVVHEDEATQQGDAHLIYWHNSKLIPNDVIVADTPDVDGDNERNWEQAYLVGRAADVVIAVITMQKVGDKKCLEFFRKIKDAGKPVIVVINQVTAGQRKRGLWKDWLTVFTNGTGIEPYKTYLIPEDDERAEAGNPEVFPVLADAKGVLELGAEPIDVLESLRKVDKGPLRRQSQAGAVWNALNGDAHQQGGVNGYLASVKARGDRFRQLLASVGARNNGEIEWPDIPNGLVKTSFDKWFAEKHRSALVKEVLGGVRVIEAPFRYLGGLFGKGKNPEDILREKEVEAIDAMLIKILDEVEESLAGSADILSRDALSLLKSGKTAAMISAIKKEYIDSRKAQTTLKVIIEEHFPLWESKNPNLVKSLRASDFVGNGLVRPVVTVGIPVVAALLGPMGVLYGVVHAISSPVSIIVGGSITSKLVSTTFDVGSAISTGLMFRSFSEEYARANVDWVLAALRKRLQPIIAELEQGAKLGTGEEFVAAEQCAERLTQWSEKYVSVGR